MKSKNFSENNSSSPDGGRRLLEQAAQKDPRITGLLSKLSEADRNQLMSVLNDPAQAKSILATPQAQALIRSLQQNSSTNGQKRSDGDK